MLDRTADPRMRRTPYGPPDAVERLAAALPGRLREALPPVIRTGSPWPVRVDVLLEDGLSEDDVDAWVPGVSVLGAGGDALDVAVRDGRVVGVRGRAADRVNHGRLDPREGDAWRRRSGRLTRPLVRDGDRLVEATWDEALDRVAARSRELLAGPGGWGRIGFHTGGRLFLEEHYTLAVIGKAGIGTPHMDGDTRWQAAAAAAALAESFGADGQPGTWTDVDHCDAVALWGHDAASADPVLWERVLDRRLGPGPPAVVAVDARDSAVTREADVHLAPRAGTNVALMNALLHELIAGNRYDPAYLAQHATGFAELCRVVEAYPAKRAAEICGVPACDIERAADVLGSAERLLSTVGPGFHRSNQAVAAACQVHNLHLLRGMLGRPGAGVLQLGGPPSGRNALETGAAGDLPGLRNWANPRHVRELADLWNVEPSVIPHWGPSTHATQIFRYAEEGSVGLLWITASDPVGAVPGLDRVLSRPDVFVVVQDPCLTDTARLADVVLPAAAWGERTGTVTSADRTVHLCEKAVEPPGEARPDLAILLDYARRMGFADRAGAPLVHWHDAESAFEAWKACTKGRPCDYTGITYERLRAGGVQWPCAPSGSHGIERLYAGGRFATSAGQCQTFGHDLATGADYGDERPEDPAGRALLHAADYEPSPEVVDEDHPLVFTTRRLPVRPAPITEASPQQGHGPGLEVHPSDAAVLGLGEGDLARVESPLGSIEARVRLSGTRPGIVVLPLPAGGDEALARAAAHLTATGWDPVARQPLRTVAAVRLSAVNGAGGARPGLGPMAVAPMTPLPAADPGVPATAGGPAEPSDRFEEV
ncbi:molybdopterin oxidoreductase family protein [Microbispora sp. ATCC PTA-5024]|uniref:molybdopterin oxidoreductase family protein n=1 Tax=Microbispora sp. ATCC PTA-5024 TaxID=316330 RepID=UPI0003DD716C|nr:molybdopterin-dependent oxidoreductase [Microbispora sp. ATCC PTA-5024]ETK32664.1 molybdopterin oxidoreductase [Microbispora sp. ATCC PTA-5024]